MGPAAIAKLGGPGTSTENVEVTQEDSSRKVVVGEPHRTDVDDFLKLLMAFAELENLETPTAEAQERLLQDIFVSKRIRLLMAYNGGQPAGYALYFYTYSSFLARPTLYLEDVFVLDRFRNLGIGRLLFKAMAKEAAREGCGRMEWACLAWNEKAIRYYDKLGAKHLSEMKLFRLDAEDIARLSLDT